MKKFERKAEVVFNEVDGYVLKRNNMFLMCPFQQPLLVPGNLAGQIGVKKQPCGSWCPLFHVELDGTYNDRYNEAGEHEGYDFAPNGEFKIEMQCSCSVKDFDVINPEIFTTESGLKLA